MTDYVIVVYVDEKESTVYLKENFSTNIIERLERGHSKNIALSTIWYSGFSMKKFYYCSSYYVCSINPYFYFFSSIPLGWKLFKISEIIQNDKIDKRIRMILENFINGIDINEIKQELTELY